MTGFGLFEASFLHAYSSQFCTSQVLADHYYGAWQPGESVTEKDVRDWAEWELAFFDVDKALKYREEMKQHAKDVVRAKAEGKAKAKPKPKRKLKCPATVKVLRASAYQHIKALDKILSNMVGKSLLEFQVDDDNRSNPLREVTQARGIEAAVDFAEYDSVSVCVIFPCPTRSPCLPRWFCTSTKARLLSV